VKRIATAGRCAWREEDVNTGRVLAPKRNMLATAIVMPVAWLGPAAPRRDKLEPALIRTRLLTERAAGRAEPDPATQ
jgi:hypothetical protein